MSVTNDGSVPIKCEDCPESYWEECTCGECAYCGRYNMVCDRAIRDCSSVNGNVDNPFSADEITHLMSLIGDCGCETCNAIRVRLSEMCNADERDG